MSRKKNVEFRVFSEETLNRFRYVSDVFCMKL